MAHQAVEVGESAEKFGAPVLHPPKKSGLKRENPLLAEGVRFIFLYFYPSQYVSYPSCTFSLLVTNWSRFTILPHIIFYPPFVTSTVSESKQT